MRSQNFKWMTILAIGLGSMFVACSQNSGTGQVPPSAPPAVAPPQTPGTAACQCGAGAAYSPTHGCLQRGACGLGQGFDTATQQCVPATIVDYNSCNPTTSGQGLRYGYSLQGLNRSVFETFLKYSLVCDPYWIGWNLGSSDCGTWSDSGFILIQGTSASATTVTIVIGAGSTTPDAATDWSTVLIGGAGYKTVSMNGVVVQEGSGIQIKGVSFSGQDNGFRIKVASGKLGDQTLNMKIQFQFKDMASAPAELF